MALIERVAVLELIRVPTWIFDGDRERMVWANRAAIALWQSPGLDEFLARDFSDMSEVTRVQMRAWLPALRRNESVELDWMIFPKGVPTLTRMTATAIELDDGRLGMLQTAIPRELGPSASLMRGTEALRHTSVVVALATYDGAILMRNPAAIRAFGDDTPLHAWFEGDEIVPAMIGAVQRGEVYRAEAPSRAGGAERWYLVEARATVDPVTGGKAMLVHLFDDTARRGAEDLAQAKERLVTQLRDAVALVEEQRRRILELSAPILRIGRSALVVPMIGSLDRLRGEEVSTRLLPAVVEQGAGSVVLDLTGVSAPDEGGLESLLHMIRALRLLGAHTILTGIRPELAAALATQGVVLEGAQILRSLAEGIDACRAAGGGGARKGAPSR